MSSSAKKMAPNEWSGAVRAHTALCAQKHQGDRGREPVLILLHGRQTIACRPASLVLSLGTLGAYIKSHYLSRHPRTGQLPIPNLYSHARPRGTHLNTRLAGVYDLKLYGEFHRAGSGERGKASAE